MVVAASLDETPPAETGPRARWTLNDLLGWAEITLGSKVTTADRTWPHDRSLVLELVDARSDHWFLKHPRDSGRFRREIRAYETAMETLGDRVPRLRGSSQEYQCLLIAAVPGESATRRRAKDPEIHRQAGALLARLHRSDWPQPSPELGERVAERRAETINWAREVLDRRDFRFLRQATAVLTKAKNPLAVPCHGDYSPRNWMIDSEGTVRVIDFGHAEPDLAVRDLLLLARKDWVGHPKLREAFFAGYGRQLDAREQAQLNAFVAITAANKLLRAIKSGNPPMIARARRSFAGLKSAETAS